METANEKEVNIAKKILRQKHLTIRSQIKERFKQEEQVIAQFLQYIDSFGKRQMTIAIYLSVGSEFATDKLLSALLERGHCVLAPVCDPATRSMAFYLCHVREAWTEGLFNIPIPPPIAANYRSSAEIDIIVVPGLAFTTAGGRLGLGGGYYDRYLATYTGKKVALAYKEQMAETLPLLKHDIRLDRIFSAD